MDSISAIEEMIKSGNAFAARALIRNHFKKKNIPIEDKIKLSNLSRRSGMPVLALKILRPLVFENKDLNLQSHPAALSSYGASLSSIGSISEALLIFNQLTRLEPLHLNKYNFNLDEIYLFQSLALFQKWNYNECLPLLKKYIRSKNISLYQKSVGLVNLVSAYLSTQNYSEADEILKELIPYLRFNKFNLLLGNALELQIQSYFLQRKYSEISENLNEAIQYLKSSSGFYYIYAQKWQLLTKLYLKKNEMSLNEIKQEFLNLKNVAIKNYNWETVRDLDLHMGILLNDHLLLNKVYFGSPLRCFRSRIRILFPDNFKLQEIFNYNNFSTDDFLTEKINYEIINDENIHNDLKIKEKNRTLLLSTLKQDTPWSQDPTNLTIKNMQLLFKDFYRPQKMGEIFSDLYPKQYFDPNTSIDRIYKVLKRTRLWIKKNKIPLEINVRNLNIFANLTSKNYMVQVSLSNTLNDKTDIFWKEIFKKYGKSYFTINQISSDVAISKRQISRIIQSAVEQNIIEIVGAGPSTKYKIA